MVAGRHRRSLHDEPARLVAEGNRGDFLDPPLSRSAPAAPNKINPKVRAKAEPKTK